MWQIKGVGVATCGTWLLLGQNSDPVEHPTHLPWVPTTFWLLLLQLQTQPKALLVGRLENLNGRFCGEREEDKLSVPLLCPS